MKRAVILALAWAVIGIGTGRAAENPAVSPQATEFFEKQVRPLLADNCFRCHGPKKQKGELRLDSRAALLKGGESGPAVVPGHPEKSLLIRAVHYADQPQMPPKGKLPAPAIAALTSWVKMGAPWPGEQANGLAASASKEAWKTHWAFQPVKKPALPSVRDAAWPKSPVDFFILAKLEANHLAPSRPADKRTLIRRATFDLTGLPPTAEEIAAFEADPSPNAFAKVVDRLLASPRYGERWGRYWLDVARYADTKGYVFTQERRFPYSYTYRDYVIRSFNEDLPYDQFIVQQLAADQLPLGEDKRPLAAMGFLTLGRRFLNNQADIIDDRIDVVSRGLLGLTVTCARCHDHKFDPIPQKDYYSLYGVFASSVEPNDLPLIGREEQSPAYQAFKKELDVRQKRLDDYLNKTHAELLTRLRGQVGDYLLAARDFGGRAGRRGRQSLEALGLNFFMVRRWQNILNETRKQHNPVFAPWHAFAALNPKDFAAQAPALARRFAANKDPRGPINPLVARMFAGKPPASLREVAQRYNALFAETDKLWRQTRQVAALQKGAPAPRGFSNPNREMLRQVLYAPGSALDIPPAEVARYTNRAVREQVTRLRRQVDQWRATAPGAPARAMVLNDLPQPVTPHVFKRGNPNNPGPAVPRQFLSVLAGPDRKPFTHGSGRLELARAIADPDNPLTARVLVNRVWMHHFGKGLVTTPADFGMRSDAPSHPELLDYLAWRFVHDGWSIKKLHRLIMLSAAYQQDSADNPGCSRADPENRLVWRQNRQRLDFEALRDALLFVSGKLDSTMGGRSVNIIDPPFTGRRTVYGFIDRQNLPGLLRTFDYASPDATMAKRYTTTVPQQALFLMNSPFVVEQARALASQPGFQAFAKPDERIRYLYRQVYGRAPDVEELALGLRFLQTLQAQGPAQAGPRPADALPPLTPWEKYAQVLLLANEFVFVD